MADPSGPSLPRHARQIMLREIGGAGQAKLADAHVAVIGAGALGGPAALYLAAAGVGRITVVDDDRVEPTNLQRQIQFSEQDIGRPKALVLAERLDALDGSLTLSSKVERLNVDTAPGLIADTDVILDATDSFASRFAVDAAARALGVPVVSGAVARFGAQVSVFRSGPDGPCYRCLVPDLPSDEGDGEDDCDAVGIVGAVAGIAASLMALEAVKLITDAGDGLSGRLWIHDGLRGSTRVVNLPRDPACRHHDSG